MYILPPGTLKLSLWPVLCIHQQPWKNPITHTFIYIYIQYIYTWYLGTLETVEHCYKQLKRFNSVFYQKRINKQNKQLIGVRFLSFYMVNHLQMHISKCISTYYITKNMRKNYRIPISSAVSAGKWLLLPCCPVAPLPHGTVGHLVVPQQRCMLRLCSGPSQEKGPEEPDLWRGERGELSAITKMHPMGIELQFGPPVMILVYKPHYKEKVHG